MKKKQAGRLIFTHAVQVDIKKRGKWLIAKLSDREAVQKECRDSGLRISWLSGYPIIVGKTLPRQLCGSETNTSTGHGSWIMNHES